MIVKSAKNRIISAAIKTFAKNGFEGSRVDEIAKEAGIPKSLIYYHFRSKDEILDVINKRLLSEYEKLIHKQIASSEDQTSKVNDTADTESPYMEFMEKNIDLIRIIFIESLKKSNKKPGLFKVVEILLKDEGNVLGTGLDDKRDKDERLIAEFFTNIIPNLAFLCFQQFWAGYYNLSKKELRDIYLKIFQQTHMAYHRKNNI